MKMIQLCAINNFKVTCFLFYSIQKFQISVAQGNQLTDSDGLKMQISQSFVARPVGSFQNQPTSQTGKYKFVDKIFN